MENSQNLQATPLLEQHRKLGARIVPFAGWQMPVQYTGVTDEHHAVRNAAGLFDVCHMGTLLFSGPGAFATLDPLVAGPIARLADGHALYTVACNSNGGILDDLIVYRASESRYMIVCNASNRPKIVSHFAPYAQGRCTFEDASPRTGLLALQGPRAWQILSLAGNVDALKNAPSFAFADITLVNIPCTIAKTGYTGEDGGEIFCPLDQVEKLWVGLLELGAQFGLKPAGLGARDTLRLECKMALYGNELDETTDPFSAGIAYAVDLAKPTFVGKDALVDIKARGLQRRLVGIEMVGRGIARHGYPVKNMSGSHAGHVTSGSPSPTLGKNIGLAYVPVNLAAHGTSLLIDCRGKDIEARVVPTPFYRRKKQETIQ